MWKAMDFMYDLVQVLVPERAVRNCEANHIAYSRSSDSSDRCKKQPGRMILNFHRGVCAIPPNHCFYYSNFASHGINKSLGEWKHLLGLD